MKELKMDKTYSPKEFEPRIYEHWMENDYFKAQVNPDKKPFTIMMPPPNITGQLHMGHALDQTLQDILTRWKRMQGFEALWLPGTDHASIATEVKVVEKIKEDEGLSKEDLGRDEFLKRAWQWRDDYGRKIVNQVKKMGSSCDWSRERFTMDEGCNQAVTEVFVKLYEKGLIYRGNRLINWCPDCRTTLSDAEVEHEEKDGKFYHVHYHLADGSGFLEIATTRPETILADTAVAVNPNDERYKALVGKMVVLPLVGRLMPIVADEYVDIAFGTGALKVTPGHDPNDFEIGKRHNLEAITVMNEDATMSDTCGKYAGMDRYECRKQIVEDLKTEGFLVAVKDHVHNVGTCYRCNTVIESRLSDQWFVKMEEMANPAIDALKDGDLQFVPDRFSKIYLNWLENIRDWCISRQLWWGHRIPAWYCNDCGEITVATSAPDKCCKCGSANLRQDNDVLDTWFSSALWPFSTLGWPNDTEDMKYFYPTDVLVTGYDIIFFWVVRMVFSAIEQTGKSPFHTVFIHGLVRAADGKKMSKSLGNGVDPLDLIDQYGADALRFMLATGNSAGNDLKFQVDKVEASRNFANKLWNASRFVLMGLQDDGPYTLDETDQLDLSDEWILSRLNSLTVDATANMDKYELGIAGAKIYEFVWNEYCDWYIEISKKRLYGTDEKAKRTVQKVLVTVLKDILKLLHPFMPFITEEIWHNVPSAEGSVIVAAWPISNPAWKRPESEKTMNVIMDAIRNIRNVRAEMDVVPSRKARLLVTGTEALKSVIMTNSDYMVSLASCSDVQLEDKASVPNDAVSVIVDGGELFLPLADLIDFSKEIERLEKEKAKLMAEVDRVEKKLGNEGFVKKAPAQLLDEEKAKLEKYQSMLATVNERLAMMAEKMNQVE